MSDIMPGAPGETNPNHHYVVMHSDRPVAVAPTLESAQVEAFALETRYRSEGESRWDAHGPDSWRLMRRTGSRGRFAWSLYAVIAVPAVAEGGAQ